ncbi:alpha/beta hydrolase family protein [Bosea sp. MMO-172]|uniref:alpha/beta hydrolase family protein n=1 Tax=Bosea sp. MMO-172 TaxID=3127885 RepID=UPI00301A167D
MSLFASGVVSICDWMVPLKYAAAASVLALGLIPSAQAEPANPWEAVENPQPGRLSVDRERAGEQAWFVPVGKDGQGADILLPTRVLVPSGSGPFPLAIVSHGSPANAAARKTMAPPEYRAGADWLLSRGYMVVLPLRRGYGPRGGTWAEAYGPCSRPDYVGGGLATADDIQNVARYFAALDTVRADRILLVGQSAGGWGSLAAASRAPAGVRAVINFAGGRGGYAGGKPNHNCSPDSLVEAAATFGRSSKIPTLWIYTQNDRFFDGALTSRMAQAYQSAGGDAEYHLLAPFGEDGHRLFPTAEGRTVWQPHADRFLDRIAGLGTKP